MFYLWRRMGEEERQRLWRLYGWYTGLMLCGSCFGAVTWAARMMALVNNFKGDHLLREGDDQALVSIALSLSWRAIFTVSYAIEFLCLSAAKLMVLDRMSDFAAPQGDGMRQRWVVWGRIVMAVVVLGNAVGLIANIAAATYFQKAAEAECTAHSLLAANNNESSSEYHEISRAESQLALSIASVQSFCEVAVLLLIIAAFVAAGLFCARRVSSALSLLDSAGPEMAAFMRMRQQVVGAAKALGRRLRREIIVATAFVFVAFALRSVFSTMSAVANRLQDPTRNCPGVFNLCDASCFNVYTHITLWMTLTPEFQLTVVLISSPIALLVALWGMTSKSMLQLMKTGRREMALMRRDLLQT
jgi:hypothetical protein